MQVELDTFSGRPNPRWDVKIEDVPELQRDFGLLPKSDVGAMIPENLGYRGLIVRNIGITPWHEIRFYRGEVTARTAAGETQVFVDKDRHFERVLFHTAADVLDRELYSVISLLAGLE